MSETEGVGAADKKVVLLLLNVYKLTGIGKNLQESQTHNFNTTRRWIISTLWAGILSITKCEPDAISCLSSLHHLQVRDEPYTLCLFQLQNWFLHWSPWTSHFQLTLYA
jgi:hypothetical protein